MWKRQAFTKICKYLKIRGADRRLLYVFQLLVVFNEAFQSIKQRPKKSQPSHEEDNKKLQSKSLIFYASLSHTGPVADN